MSVSDQLSAAILCGGKSRRMGSDKAKLKTGGVKSPAFLDNLVSADKYVNLAFFELADNFRLLLRAFES